MFATHSARSTLTRGICSTSWPSPRGGAWAALIDGRHTMEGRSDAIPSVELAPAEGLATAEESPLQRPSGNLHRRLFWPSPPAAANKPRTSIPFPVSHVGFAGPCVRQCPESRALPERWVDFLVLSLAILLMPTAHECLSTVPRRCPPHVCPRNPRAFTPGFCATPRLQAAIPAARSKGIEQVESIREARLPELVGCIGVANSYGVTPASKTRALLSHLQLRRAIELPLAGVLGKRTGGVPVEPLLGALPNQWSAGRRRKIPATGSKCARLVGGFPGKTNKSGRWESIRG